MDYLLYLPFTILPRHQRIFLDARLQIAGPTSPLPFVIIGQSLLPVWVSNPGYLAAVSWSGQMVKASAACVM